MKLKEESENKIKEMKNKKNEIKNYVETKINILDVNYMMN